MVSRIGGDEFLILLKDVNQNQIEEISKRIIERIQEKIMINNISFTVGASIGVSIFPEHGGTIDALISKSDEAMYKVKKEGKNNLEILSI